MTLKVMEIAPINNNIVKKTRVAVYARVSCEKDTMLHSLKAQIDYYKVYISKNPEWVFVGVFADEAKTGTKDSREEFQSLLAKCRNKEVDMVITKSISRFARNTVTLLSTVRELKSLGINVFFEDQNINSLSEEGEMMLTLLAGVAQEESLDCSESVKWRIRKKFERGETTPFRMLGYKLIDGEIVVVEEEAELVRRIFDMYLSGKGTQMISNILQSEEIKTRTISNWTSNTISRILKNEKYKGDLLLQKSFISDHISKRKKINQGQKPQYYVEGNHQYIIEPELFDKVQRILNSKKNSNAKEPELSCFSGKLLCEICGAHYTKKRTNGIVKWQCRTFDKKGKNYCASRAIRDDVLKLTTAKALHMHEFDEDEFDKRVSNVIVCDNNILKYCLKDGSSIEAMWSNPSRKDSWTAEMREKARERSLMQYGK